MNMSPHVQTLKWTWGPVRQSSLQLAAENHLLNVTEWASSYLLRARCGALQRGAFEGAAGALCIHADESDLKPYLTWLHLTKPNLTSPVFREWWQLRALQHQKRTETSGAQWWKQPKHGTKPPAWSPDDESLSSLKVSGLGSPLCGLRPTDKTEIPTRDINHSMTHLTHRPLSSAEHPIIRLNAAGSYEASLSNG